MHALSLDLDDVTLTNSVFNLPWHRRVDLSLRLLTCINLNMSLGAEFAEG